MSCQVCASISGEKRLSPAPCLYEGKFWNVEHGYPSNYNGWIVVVLKRHAEALHELSTEEFLELIYLQEFCVKLLHKKLKSEKEVIFILGEKPGFKHLHVHIISVSYDLPVSQRGAQLLAQVQCAEDEVNHDSLMTTCETLQSGFSTFING